jgi:hypothetical protein
MLKFENLKGALNNFGQKVVSDARANLQSSGKVHTGELMNSIFTTGAKFSKNSMELGFEMSYYGAFIEKGVRGAGGVRKQTSTFNRSDNKGKIWKQKGGNSPYSFKEGTKPSVKHFIDWSNSKGLNPFAVRESVFRQGIKPTPFLSKAVEKNIGLLPNEIATAFAFDVQSTLDFMIKTNLKKKNA